jgi:hypothetical protein
MLGFQTWGPRTIMVTGSSITRRGKPHVLFRPSQRAGDAGKNLGCVARGEAVVKAMGGWRGAEGLHARGTGRHQGAFGQFVPRCEPWHGTGWEDRQYRMPEMTKDQREYLERLREAERNPDMNIRLGRAAA